VLIRLGGWKDFNVIPRYSHLAPDHIATGPEPRKSLAGRAYGKAKGIAQKRALSGDNLNCRTS
jgi:hypothetical protein